MTMLEDILRRTAPPSDPETVRALSLHATQAAVAAGAVPITYALTPSPLGELLVAGSRHGIVRIAYTRFTPADDVLTLLAERISPAIVETPSGLDQARRELDEYFAGDRTTFDLPLDLALVRGPFGRRVLEQTGRIAFGDAASYAQIAARAGSPRAVRAAGNALGANPIPIVIPCHRVLRTGGGLGGYTGGLAAKRHLLALEGHDEL